MLQDDLRIVSARFDAEKWSLELVLTNGDTDSWDLMKFDGLGMDPEKLKRVLVSDDGGEVEFPDAEARLVFERNTD